ncbi:LysR family transcriptional regulator [Vibrio sp. ZSDZ34]|jgi:DNA-binding transcriptional LysR family regulator|uniref:LysR family transcriptional regulator n=1 Tax=Vibrio gelatinilyticus TaxID=2893468 RepID=A0A9X1WCC1_9VIBR|nr:LysR family transcriptional regulator [Vibrio gelatinilyticus]MCJ2377674.1 LysR family transcriptional regulator [Vibrio gelatinilyticus]
MLRGSALPSTKALRTFVVVANSLSFSKAAKELSVTQGAVSKQIASLEQQLGQTLFERHLNGIVLTIAGEQYLPHIIEALEQVQRATAELAQSEQKEETLSLNVTPSFASLWLVGALDDFCQKHTNLSISIRTGDGPLRTVNSDDDIVIRCLPIAQHYKNAHLLRSESLRLVGSSTLLTQKPITVINDLKQHDFLSHVTRPQLWEQFKSSEQIQHTLNFYGVGFEHFFMSLEAVRAHAGLALLPDFMVDGLVERQQLKNPLNLELTSGYGYYAIIPSYKLNSRLVYLFQRWLKEQLQ